MSFSLSLRGCSKPMGISGFSPLPAPHCQAWWMLACQGEPASACQGVWQYSAARLSCHHAGPASSLSPDLEHRSLAHRPLRLAPNEFIPSFTS